MRIAYIVPSLANKGPVIVVKDLVTQMCMNGHDCVVFYFDDIIQLEFMCETRHISQNLAINFLEFDIVHSHCLRPDKFVYRFREYSGKVIYLSTLHNYVMPDLRYQYNWIIAQVFGRLWMRWLKRHDKVITLSSDAVNYYARWVDEKKLNYVYNTRDLDRTKMLSDDELNELMDFKGRYKLIGVNALLSKRKGVDFIIRALNSLQDYKLFIVGDGKERRYLEKLACEMKVEGRCYFAGLKFDAYRYLPYYDIFAMPSRSEGFPLALLEAAIYSCPSVVSDIPIVKEAFNTKEVSVFSLNNPDTIVSAILRATDNSELGQNMHLRYLQCYSPKIMYQKYLSIYEHDS